jgi:ribosomal protein S18 acetylase RimI-like enzyme
MDVTIRRGTIGDAAAIASVHVSSWRSTYAGIVPDAYLASLNVEERAQNWEKHLAAQKAIFLVAEDEAGIFGFACGGKLRDELAGYDAELYAIYLLSERQRRGTGRSLTRSLADALRDEGFKSMVVWVLERNPAVAFYRRLGAVQIAQKTIEIGGAPLEELAFGWPDFDLCFQRKTVTAATSLP